MKTRIASFGLALMLALQIQAQAFRPPSVPLVTFDPYLSIWSPADQLADHSTQHWTRHPQPLNSLVRIDGQTFRLMGVEPATVAALSQVGLELTPTRSTYEFENTNVHVTLTFLRPALPNDLDAMGLPITYLTWQVRSVDGQKHNVALFESTSALIAVNKPDESVAWRHEKKGGLSILRAGTAAQPVLGSCGDDHRINWGYVYAAAKSGESIARIGSAAELASTFVSSGKMRGHDDVQMPRPANDKSPALAFEFNLGRVSSVPVSRTMIIGYDEVFAIKYFGRNLLPYWKRNGISAEQMLKKAAALHTKLAERCAAFDSALMADATEAGGEKYAQMCALAYRQCAAACGLAADANKKPLFFTKENTSNGDIATTDVFFPMDPQWLLLSPSLAKATLVPILSYAASSHWKFPNAPHDLGTYPIARGTDDGGEGMPVEESGNMLILCDAVAHAEGNANFVSPWWNQLTQWAEYLKAYGLDPEDQLCTDDFMGHLAHNANLSIKAILGLACYGDLCRIRGEENSAREYFELARKDAQHWMQADVEGDHYKLAFDKPNTWSQKYNLVWDKILGLNIFPDEVAQKEIAYYKTRLQRYGLPLDSRTKLTKTDWSFWSATLADDRRDFETIISPIYDYLNQTTARSPFADSYKTDNVHSDGMHARPVIGGVFIKMLAERDLWKKWSSLDTNHVEGWAALPVGPKINEIIPSARKTPALWHYTMKKPASDWVKPDFGDGLWKEGYGSFGTTGTPGAAVHTRWSSEDIWLRREITLPNTTFSNLVFYVHHDEDVEIYVDGVLAATEAGFTTDYVPLEIHPSALKYLKPGAKVTLAVHCHQTVGGQNVDVGLASVEYPKQ